MNSKERYKQILRFTIFLAFTALLFWWVYRDQDWTETFEALKTDVNYTWVWVGIILGILSHIARALRWQQLTDSMGYKMTLMNSFMGVMIGYFANMIIPRAGEVARCGVVSKYENIPTSKLLGNVIGERVIDMAILLTMTIITIVWQLPTFALFFEKHIAVGDNLADKSEYMIKMGLIAFAALILVASLIFLMRKSKLVAKIKPFINGLKEGIWTIKKVKNVWLFIFYSVFIWIMYFLMLYVSFFCFDFSSNLGIGVALTAFVTSCYGMVAPVQGGIGAWHFMVIASMMLFLPDTPEMQANTRTFAFLTHGSMTMLYIVLGTLCLATMPLYNKFRKK